MNGKIKRSKKFKDRSTEGDPNLSVYRVRTVQYPTVFREGPFWSTAQRTVFRDFSVKAGTLPRFKFYRSYV
jgi:hypothetical protein